MQLTKKQVLILIGVLVFIFFLVYTPHFDNRFPIHIDEWHHIEEAMKIKQGVYKFGVVGVELGFHIFLAFILFFVDLLFIYKFLPAIWAVITAFVLFLIIRNKTFHSKDGFLIAIFSMIFFASIKSNTNIIGLWFFTPLTFAIPLIYLYIHFFTKGFEERKKKYVLISLLIMLLLIPIHSISFLFAIPILFIYSLFHLNYLKKEWVFFSLFLIIPFAGVFFFSWLFNITFIEGFFRLFNDLQFKYGWGVLERNNSPFEIYSFIGYVFAFIGGMMILSKERLRKKYLIFPLWTLSVLAYLIIFKITGISFLSPHQRNIYYFAISLPILSAFGFVTILNTIALKIKDLDTYKLIKIILIIVVLLLTFLNYNTIPQDTRLYKVIDNSNYDALKFLSDISPEEDSKVMAPVFVSTAMFSVSGHEPVGTIFFYGNRKDVEIFFNGNSTECDVRNELIKKYNVRYVLSEKVMDCGWEEVYEKEENWVYEIIG